MEAASNRPALPLINHGGSFQPPSPEQPKKNLTL